LKEGQLFSIVRRNSQRGKTVMRLFEEHVGFALRIHVERVFSIARSQRRNKPAFTVRGPEERIDGLSARYLNLRISAALKRNATNPVCLSPGIHRRDLRAVGRQRKYRE